MRRRTVLAAVALAGVLGGVGLTAAAVDRPVASGSVLVAADAARGALGATDVVRLGYAGIARTYRLFVPAALPVGPRPLLVALHGYTGTAQAFETSTRLDRSAAVAGVVVAYPQGAWRSWDAGTCCGRAAARGLDDVGFLTTVIHDVAGRVPVDPRRVAIVGFSNGGMMAYRYGCTRADLVSAVVVMSGTLVTPSCTPSRPVSVLHVHGLVDDVVPFDGVRRSRLDRSGFPQVRTVLERWTALDACRGWVSDPGHVAVLDGVRCRAATRVRLVTSADLGHRWPVGGADAQRYGVDMTEATWRFLASVWR